MAVISVDEVGGCEGFITRDWLSNYKRTFQVICSGNTDGPKTVMDALGIVIGDTYEFGSESDSNSFVTAVNARQITEVVIQASESGGPGKGWQWVCEVVYEPYDITLFPENPLDMRPEINWDFVQFEQEVDEDVDGNPIVNTATVPFNPKIKIDVSRPVLTIARNEQTYNPSQAFLFNDKVNKESFFGFEAGKVKIGNITAVEQWHPKCGLYVRVNYVFHVKNDGWPQKVLSAGYQQLVDDEVQPIYVKPGVQTSEPQMLDEEGLVAEPGADPVFLTFHVDDEISFTGLGFDQLSQDLGYG